MAEALLKFRSGGAGKFYLTCREYYQVAPLNVPEVRLDCFTRDDQIRFVKVFLSKFAIMRDDPEIVVSQLEGRGFKGFLSHPLLLTLACIVRTSSTSVQPFNLVVHCDFWSVRWRYYVFGGMSISTLTGQATTPLDGSDPSSLTETHRV